MVSSKVFMELCAADYGSLRNFGHYQVVYASGECVDMKALPFSSASAVAECVQWCSLSEVVCCAYFLPDGRMVCNAVVL